MCEASVEATLMLSVMEHTLGPALSCTENKYNPVPPHKTCSKRYVTGAGFNPAS